MDSASSAAMQMLFGVGLEDEAAHAGAKDFNDDLFAVVHRVEQDLDPREFALERMGKIEAIQLGDRIIEDRDVRTGFPRELQARPAVRRLADDLVIGLALPAAGERPDGWRRDRRQ